MFRIKRSDIKGPVLQFQSTIHDKEDIYKLLKSINDACGDQGIEETRLEKTFAVWWPKLDEELSQIPSPQEAQEVTSNQPEEMYGYVSRVLEEVLEVSRTNQRLLRDPTTLLPVDYFEHVLDRLNRDSRLRKRSMEERIIEERIHPAALEELVVRYREFLKFFGKTRHKFGENPEMMEELLFLLRRMDDPLRYLCNNIGMRLPKEMLDEFDRL